MKKRFILCCITLIAIAPICFGQASPPNSGKAAPNESAISDLEKSAWDAFKTLLSKDYCGVYADGVKTLDGEVANMTKTDLRDYSFAEVKVVFPHPKVAVITYKATQH